MTGPWCIVAYRTLGGMDVFGPYEIRAVAATKAVVLAARDGYQDAYVLPLLVAS